MSDLETQIKLLQQEEEASRHQAVRSLRSQGPEKAIPILRAFLRDSSSRIRASVISSLRRFEACDIVPELLEMLEQGESVNVRLAIIRAFGAFAELTSLQALYNASKDPHQEIQYCAQKSIEKFGFSTSELEQFSNWSVEYLQERLLQNIAEDEKKAIRFRALRVLMKKPSLDLTHKLFSSGIRGNVLQILGESAKEIQSDDERWGILRSLLSMGELYRSWDLLRLFIENWPKGSVVDASEYIAAHIESWNPIDKYCHSHVLISQAGVPLSQEKRPVWWDWVRALYISDTKRKHAVKLLQNKMLQNLEILLFYRFDLRDRVLLQTLAKTTHLNRIQTICLYYDAEKFDYNGLGELSQSIGLPTDVTFALNLYFGNVDQLPWHKKTLSKVKSLTLEFASLSTSLVLGLLGSQLFSEVEQLTFYFGKWNVSSSKFKSLGKTQTMNKIRSLSFKHNDLSWKDLLSFLQHVKLPHLKNLSLGGNSIGNQGSKVLADWPGLVALDSLELCDTGISKQGIASLKKSFYYPNHQAFKLEHSS